MWYVSLLLYFPITDLCSLFCLPGTARILDCSTHTHTHTHKNQTENLREFEHLRYIPIVLLSPVGIVVSEMPVVSLLTSRFKQPNTPRLNRMYFKYSFIPVTDIILFQSPLLI